MRPTVWPIVSLSFVDLVWAQANTFAWGFLGGTPEATQLLLPQCGRIVVQAYPTDLQGNNVTLQPPFTMFAYEPGGSTTNSLLIGNDPSNMTWLVPHAAGKQVILQMADSKGNTGGVAPNLFNITNTPNTDCLPPTTRTSLTMKTYKTALATCDPLTIDLYDGRKPYTVTIVAANSPVVTNWTMGPQDDQYTWIDRALPGLQMLVVAHDANGDYTNNSPIINTSGPPDTSCPGKVSRSGARGSTTSTTIGPSGAADDKGGLKPGAIGGIAAGSAVLVLAIVALIFFLCINKKKKGGSTGYHAAQQPTPYRVEDPYNRQPHSPPIAEYGQNQYVFNNFPVDGGVAQSVHLSYVPASTAPGSPQAYSRDSKYSSASASSTGGGRQSVVYPHPSNILTPNSQYGEYMATPLTDLPPSVGRATSSAGFTHRSGSSSMGGYPGQFGEGSTAPESSYGGTSSPPPPSLPKGALAPGAAPRVVQHRDAGPVVEIPPAYQPPSEQNQQPR